MENTNKKHTHTQWDEPTKETKWMKISVHFKPSKWCVLLLLYIDKYLLWTLWNTMDTYYKYNAGICFSINVATLRISTFRWRKWRVICVCDRCLLHLGIINSLNCVQSTPILFVLSNTKKISTVWYTVIDHCFFNNLPILRQWTQLSKMKSLKRKVNRTNDIDDI